MTKIFISAGEASGDLHAAAITKEILALEPQAEIFGMGGEALAKAGGEVLFNYKEYSIMGLMEILRALPRFFRLRDKFRQVMVERQPDCFVTVDYPEFNMRVAKEAKRLNIPIVAYIPPSAWAWRRGRALDVAKLVTKVACIYPFAYDVYKAAGADAEFVGNPLVDIVRTHLPRQEALAKVGKCEGRQLVLLLPGSRVKEIVNVLPIMLKALPLIKQAHPEVDFVLAKAGNIEEELLTKVLAQSSTPVKVVEGDNYDVMSVCDAAIATSGTVTLEAALCGLPSVICYKANAVSVAFAKRLVKVKYIGLPNILAGKEILPELIQEKLTPEKIAAGVVEFLRPECYRAIREELKGAVKKLGEPGGTKKVAELILKVAGDKR